LVFCWQFDTGAESRKCFFFGAAYMWFGEEWAALRHSYLCMCCDAEEKEKKEMSVLCYAAFLRCVIDLWLARCGGGCCC
jgi:hypothetical protein